MPWYRWLVAILLGLAALWPTSAFIAFALWKKYFKEPREDENKEWWRALKLGLIGFLQIAGVGLFNVAAFIWLLANGVCIGTLQIGNQRIQRKGWGQQMLRWLLMPVVLPINLVGTAVYWTLLWITFKLDDLGLTSLSRRIPRPTT